MCTEFAYHIDSDRFHDWDCTYGLRAELRCFCKLFAISKSKFRGEKHLDSFFTN